MRRFLMTCGYVILLPVWAGLVIRMGVDAYRGENLHYGYVGVALILAAVVWGALRDRFAKPAAEPKQITSTIYDYIESDDGVEFYARREDGTEHAFFIAKGSTVTRTETAS